MYKCVCIYINMCVYVNIYYVRSVKRSACMAKFFFCEHDFCRLCLCAFEIRIHIFEASSLRPRTLVA